MKPHLAFLAISLTLNLLAATVQGMNDDAVGDVLKLHNAGLRDENIVAFIKGKNVKYKLSSDDVVLLRKHGLSPAVLAAMLESGGALDLPDPAPPARPRRLPGPPPGPPPMGVVPAPQLSPDATYFYEQLKPYGKWVVVEDNQWSWQPAVAITTPNWRPYWNAGNWVYTESGWCWTSEYPWGWAAFHYGRWSLHPMHGWIWFPDRIWAPAWVAWRSGGEYCGWAPLPPGTYFDNTGGLAFHGRRVAVDFDFGLDWRHFSFCRVKDLGEKRAFRRDQDRRGVFTQTTVINHYSVNRRVVDHQTDITVINHGIDPKRVAAVRGRNVDVVTIHELPAPGPRRTSEHFDKGGRRLEIYRPHWGDHDGRR